MKRPRQIKWFSMGAAFLILISAAFAFWPFRFYYDSVCSQCGAAKWTTEWQLPYSQTSLYSHSSVQETALSSYLARSGYIGTHSHRWLFGHGGGNGVRCALGDGDSIRQSVTSPNVECY